MAPRHLGDWIRSLEARNLRPSTIKTYKSALMLYSHFLDTDGQPFARDKHAKPLQLVQAYQLWLQRRASGRTGNRFDSSTVVLYLRALNAYFDWEVAQSHRKKNPFRRLSYPRLDPDHREILTTAQLRSLFTATERLRRPWEPTMVRAALALMAGAGLRAHEARNLPEKAVSLERREIVVHVQKNRKVSVLPITSPFAEFHRDWLARRAELVTQYRARENPTGKPIGDGYLFLTPWHALGEEGIYTVFRRLLHLAEIQDEGLTPHALRHHFISTVARAGGMAAAQELGRHSSIVTTRRYVHHRREELWAAAEAAGCIWNDDIIARLQNALRGQPELPGLS